MSSLVAEDRDDTGDDTALLPALPSSLFAESLTYEASAAPEESASLAAAHNAAVLGPTLCFKGELSAQEDFILQGRVEGTIHQAQSIFIAIGGAVVGSIHARAVVVDGNVDGDLYGLESVTVHKTGRVVGNIFAPRVVLVEGAVFNGRIDMSGASVVAQDGNRGGNSGPGLKLAAEQTDKVPAQKLIVVPPPPVRERAVRELIA